MTPRHLFRLSVWLCLVTPLAAACADDPPSPDATLKAKGLRRSGTTYVLAAEGEAQSHLNAARTLFRAASAAAAEKTAYERGLAANQAEMHQMEQQYLALNQSLAAGGLPPAQNNQVVGMINMLSIRLDAMRRERSEETRQAVAARVGSTRESFIQAVLDLRQLVDKTDAHYKKLDADQDVKAALEALNAAPASKTRFTLGPSRSYLANLKLLERIEGSVLTDDVPLRKQAGVFWVDATLNGKVTKPMIFDTGASIVVLPADLAAQVGLTPGPDAPEVTAHVADGSDVKAHRMFVPSLRVGKFTVSNVECVVMPPTKKDVAPLLGQTFQRNFSIHLNVDAGKLVLTKLDTGETESSSTGSGKPRSKATAKPGRGKRP